MTERILFLYSAGFWTMHRLSRGVCTHHTVCYASNNKFKENTSNLNYSTCFLQAKKKRLLDRIMRHAWCMPRVKEILEELL